MQGITLTPRQEEILALIKAGRTAREVADELGISRNSVYQSLQRLRRRGALPQGFTPSGMAPRESATSARVAAPQSSRLEALRVLDTDSDRYLDLITESIAEGDVAALAYELGRGDVGGWDQIPERLVESALRRLGLLGGST